MYVVAGATGRTGSVVAETLLGKGKQVRVLVRDRAKSASWQARGAETDASSLDDTSGLERALRGAAGFYVLLPEDLSQQDFDGHRRRVVAAVAAAVERARVPHVVLLSGTAAFLSEGNGLAKGLHEFEQRLHATGARVTALRSVGFQENVIFSLPAALHEGIFPNFFPSADVAFPTLATRDAGRFAAYALLEAPAKSETIDVVGPMYSLRQMAEKLGAALRRDLRVVDVPPAKQVSMLTQAGLPRAFAEALVEFYACVAAGKVTPQGDRMVAGTTTLDEILPRLVAGASAVS